MNNGKILDEAFYQRTDVLSICKELIGKVLISNVNQEYTSGIIVEAEAYRGPDDKACHAYNHRRTLRTETMYARGGVAYIYLCYGIHSLFNVVTGPINFAHAVLIRGLQPLEGADIMAERRKLSEGDYRLTKGPGALAQAMSLHKRMDGSSLIDPDGLIYIEDRGIHFNDQELLTTARIGVESAGEAALWPWRYIVKKNKWVSGSANQNR